MQQNTNMQPNVFFSVVWKTIMLLVPVSMKTFSQNLIMQTHKILYYIFLPRAYHIFAMWHYINRMLHITISHKIHYHYCNLQSFLVKKIKHNKCVVFIWQYTKGFNFDMILPWHIIAFCLCNCSSIITPSYITYFINIKLITTDTTKICLQSFYMYNTTKPQ